MSEPNKEALELGDDLYLVATSWEGVFPDELIIKKESQYGMNDIDIDITRKQALEIIRFLERHYKF
jgi:hypothetical protein